MLISVFAAVLEGHQSKTTSYYADIDAITTAILYQYLLENAGRAICDHFEPVSSIEAIDNSKEIDNADNMASAGDMDSIDERDIPDQITVSIGAAEMVDQTSTQQYTV